VAKTCSAAVRESEDEAAGEAQRSHPETGSQEAAEKEFLTKRSQSFQRKGFPGPQKYGDRILFSL